MSFRPRLLTLLTATAALTATVVVTVTPFLRFAYRAPAMHVAFETAESLIALLIAYLAFGKLREEGSIRDAAIVVGFLILGLTNLLFAAVPRVMTLESADRFATWVPLMSRLVGTAALAYAAFAEDSRLPDPRMAARRSVTVTLGLLVLVGGLFAVLSPFLPEGVEAARALEASRPHIESHSVVLIAQVLSLLIWGMASVGFTRGAERTGDELLLWFGAGSALSAVARFNYILFPSLYTDFVYVGDVMRIGAYAMFLFGASRVIRSYWTGLAEAAILRERSRLAEDLHDGITQELTFIAAQTRKLMASDPRKRETKMLAGAAERAAAEARRAMAALTRRDEQSLSESIVEVTEELCNRVGARARFDVQEGINVDPRAREMLTRIVWEAVSNSLRHGQAGLIEVSMRSAQAGFRIEVRDDGSGFSLGDTDIMKDGFGLALMRQRAGTLGADIEVSSEIGRGTTIAVDVRDKDANTDSLGAE